MMRAVQASEKGAELSVVADRPIPQLSAPTDVIVKIETAALNPVDVLMVDTGMMVKSWPHVFGCDMAGTVHEVGEGAVEKFKIGDRVWAYTSLGEAHSGTLAEYVKVPASLLGRVPDSVAFEQASTVGVGFETAALLLHAVGEARAGGDGDEAGPILVYGASSSVGQYAVQLAKSYGHKVVGVASDRNRALVLELGANEAVDYNAENWEKTAADALGGAGCGAKALIAVSSPEILAAVTRVLHACDGQRASSVAPWDEGEHNGVQVTGVDLGSAFDSAEARPVIERFVKVADDMLANDELKVNAVKVLQGGLEAAGEGFQLLRDKKVSGEKLVLRIIT